MAPRPESPAAPDTRDGERRLAAVVFTDIVGYSGVVHKNEKLGQKMVSRQNAVVRSVLPRFHGRVVKSTGDGFLLEFGSALSAVKAVAAIQTQLATDGQADAVPVILRASVHLGDVDPIAGDLYGDGVNIAARLMPLAPEGGMAISAGVRMQVRQQLDLELRSIGTPPLKNIESPLEVFVADAPALHALGKALDAEATAPETAATAPPARGRAWGRPLAIAGIVLLVVAVTLGIVHRTRTAGPAVDAAQPTVAVLPLVNTSGDTDNEYFSDGLSEELINTLGRMNNLKVVGRASSFQFKNTKEGTRTIAEKLGVGYVVDGSVRKASDRVRIAIALVRAADGTSLWSESYDRELKDIFAVQSEIATAVAGELQRSLGIATTQAPAGASEIGKPPSGDVEAYQALLQGNFYARRRTREDTGRAIGFYERAIALDPGYALAHANLARSLIEYTGIYNWVTDAEGLRSRARAAAATALKLEPDLAEAHVARALERQMLDLRLEDAEKEYRRAAELAPNDAVVMVTLGDLQLDRGSTGPALAAFERAIALDPLLVRPHFRRGFLLDVVGRYDEAEAALRKAMEIEPQAALLRASLAVVKLHQGDTAAAVAVAREEPDPFWHKWALVGALFAHGDRKEADALLDAFIREYADVGAFQIAEIYALRKDPDAVFHWLDHALATRDPGVTQLFTSSPLAAYRDDPRYTAIARKVGLDPANAPAPPKGAR